MKTEKGDFILLNDAQASKPLLVEITKAKDKKLVGVLSVEERAEHGDEKFRVSFEQEDVAINLGPNPPVGKSVMGVKIEPFIDRLKLAPFACAAALLDTVDEAEITALKKAAAKLYAKLKKYGATDHTRHWYVAIRPKTGAMTGQWKYSQRTGVEHMNLFTGGKETPDWFYVMAHEFGHHIWQRCMTAKQKARWIDRHHKAMTFSEISVSQLTRMRTELERAGSIKAYRKLLRANDKEAETNEMEKFVEAMKAAMKLNNATADHYDAIMESGESLSDYWLKTPLPQVDRNVIITEYALTNATELFCECLAHALTGMEMPKKLRKLTFGSFKKAIANGMIDTGGKKDDSEDE